MVEIKKVRNFAIMDRDNWHRAGDAGSDNVLLDATMQTSVK